MPPLIGPSTYVTAYRFAEELEKPRLFADGQSAGFQDRFREFLPAPRWNDPRYRFLNTSFVRSIIESFDDSLANAQVEARDREVFMLIVSDNIFEGRNDGSLAQEYQKRFVDLEGRRQRLLTIGVKCTPELADWNHTILITVDRYGPKTPRQRAVIMETPKPTPETTPAPVAKVIPPPPPPRLAVTVPQKMLRLRGQGGKVLSGAFKISVDGHTVGEMPLPALTARLLTAKGEPIGSGSVVFGDVTCLPAEGRLVFATLILKQRKIPAMAELALTSESQKTYASVSPAQVPVQIERRTSAIVLPVLLLVIIAVVAVALIQYLRTNSPPARAPIRLVLESGGRESSSLSFDLPPNESYVIGQDFRDIKWFEGISCRPWTLHYKRRPWAGEVVLGDPQTGEERPVPVTAGSKTHEELMLRELGDGLRTWKLLVTVGATDGAAVAPEAKSIAR